MKKSELRKLIKQTIKEQHINSKQTKLASGGRPVGTTTTNACPPEVNQAISMLGKGQTPQQQAKIFKWIASLFKCKGHGNPGGGAGSGGGDPMNDFEDFIIGADDDDFV